MKRWNTAHWDNHDAAQRGNTDSLWVLSAESQPTPRLRIWDLSREKYSVLSTVEGHREVKCLWATAILADFGALRALVCTRERRLELWDLRKMNKPIGLSSDGIGGAPGALRVESLGSAQPRALCASSDGIVRVVDVSGDSAYLPTLLSLYGHADEVCWATMSENNRNGDNFRAATMSADHEVLFWNVKPYRLDAEDELERQQLDSRHLDDTSITLKDLRPKRLKAGPRFKTRAAAYHHVDSDYRIIALSGSLDGALHAWYQPGGRNPRDNSTTFEEAEELTGHTDQVTSISADLGKALAAVSGSCDTTLRVWKLDTDFHVGCEATLEGHSESVRAVVADFQWDRALSSSADETVKIWSLGLGKSEQKSEPGLLSTLQPGSVLREAMVSFTSGTAVFVTRPGSLEVWDLTTSTKMRELQGHPGAMFAVQMGGRGPLQDQFDLSESDVSASEASQEEAADASPKCADEEPPGMQKRSSLRLQHKRGSMRMAESQAVTRRQAIADPRAATSVANSVNLLTAGPLAWTGGPGWSRTML